MDEDLKTLEDQIALLKSTHWSNYSTQHEKSGVQQELKLTLQELLNEKTNKLKTLENEFHDLSNDLKRTATEHGKAEEYLKRETILIEQEQKFALERAEEMKVKNECLQQYNQRLTRASSKLSSKDLALIQTYKKKLCAYKRMSGVTWDYASCTASEISGYIRCLGDSKLKIFHLDIEGKHKDIIADEIWDKIEKYNTSTQLQKVIY